MMTKTESRVDRVNVDIRPALDDGDGKIGFDVVDDRRRRCSEDSPDSEKLRSSSGS